MVLATGEKPTGPQQAHTDEEKKDEAPQDDRQDGQGAEKEEEEEEQEEEEGGGRATQERQRACLVEGCQAVFTDREEWRRHVNLHILGRKTAPHRGGSRGVKGPRPRRDKESIKARKKYRCRLPGCTRAFTEQRNLDQHYKTGHSDARPFKCYISGCGAAFKYKCVLDRHLEARHEAPLMRGDEDYEEVVQDERGDTPEVLLQQRARRSGTMSKAMLRALQVADRNSAEYRRMFFDAVLGVGGGGV